jgi:hypothetical protein
VLLEEGGGERFSVVLEVPEGLAVPVLGVGLQAEGELAAEVGALRDF